MERIQSINSERIEWCCADRGMTPGELASRLDISEDTVRRVMDGRDGMTFGQLQKMAGYFGRGVLFFLETGPVDEARIHTSQFRTLANQKPELSARLKGLIERAEKQREVYLSLREDLDDSGQPLFSPPATAPQDPAEAAGHARQWLGLSDRNSFDTYRAAVEARGVLVFRSNGYAGRWQIDKDDPILGFTLYHPTCPVIVVKKQSAEARQSFTLMHELGHLLLHMISSIDDEQDMQSHDGREREANSFAGHLLVPDDLLTTIIDRGIPGDVAQYDDWLRRQCKDWGVSAEVILRRLLNTGRLAPKDYNAYRRWRNRMPLPQEGSGGKRYRYREPGHIFGDTFVRTVLGALNARLVTLSKASSYLDGLKISDLHQLERHYAGL